MTPDADLRAYKRVNQRLLGLIQGERAPAAPGAGRNERAAARLAQTRSLLKVLGDPQEQYPIIHVTGTSGKGSVSAMIAEILTVAGYRVGLRTSPYLQVATEKLQLGSQLIDAQSLDRVSAMVLAAHERRFPRLRLGYPEAWSALSFAWFAEKNVDVAVVEVGAGGRFDTTNVSDPVVSVITSVGLDHTVALGPTLVDIAWHKAGIIKPGAVAVIGAIPDEARRIVEDEVRSVGATVVCALERSTARPLLPRMAGAFQRANAEIAVTAAEALAGRGFLAEKEAVAAGIASARLPGRLEKMPGADQPVVWLDGAHNVDKIAALTRESRIIAAGGQYPVVVLGLLKTKDAAGILAAIAPFAGAVVATEPTVVGRSSLGASDLATEIRAVSYGGPVLVEPDPHEALCRAEMLARERGSNVVVTGSMYMVGQLRGRWHPDEQIVVQRTPWPSKQANIDQALPERSVAL